MSKVHYKIKKLENHKSLRQARVKFTEKEQGFLDNYKIKAATEDAAKSWASLKKDGRAFASKLERVRKAMVAGNSPTSLFSNWLKSVGIPRATAYWTLKRYGKSTKGRTTPLIKQLLKDRDKLAAKLAITAAKLKAERSKDKRKDLTAEMKETQAKITTKSEQIKTQRESLEDQIESAFKNVREKVSRIAWFSKHSDDQAPLLKTVASETQSIVEELKELNLDWKQSGDLLVKVLSAISTGRDPFDVVRPMVGKKPAASIRPTAHPAAQPQG
jgi:hypothetical protein